MKNFEIDGYHTIRLYWGYYYIWQTLEFVGEPTSVITPQLEEEVLRQVMDTPSARIGKKCGRVKCQL